MTANPEQFVIDGTLAVAVLNYLASKPYLEVAGMIQKLQELESVVAPVPTAALPQVDRV